MKIVLSISFEDLVWLHGIVERMDCNVQNSIRSQLLEILKQGEQCDS